MALRIVFFGDSLAEGIPGVSYFDILEKDLPEHALINQGRGGDTVVGLYRRIENLKLHEHIDISFVWVGVNDVFYNMDWLSFPNEDSLGQPWSELMSHFRKYYRFVLDDLFMVSAKVATVPPLFIGEDLSSIWNQKVEEIAQNIEEVTTQYENAEYLDLRSVFISRLRELRGNNALASSAASAIVQVRDENASNGSMDGALPWQGESEFTIDGVHLNGAGAQIVAHVFAEKIRSILVELDQ